MSDKQLLIITLSTINIFMFVGWLKDVIITSYKLHNYEKMMKSSGIQFSHIKKANFKQIMRGNHES